MGARLRAGGRGGGRVSPAQWKWLELLKPSWTPLKWKSMHPKTRHGLIRRGWVEFRRVGDPTVGQVILMARLTPEGRELRDRIHRKQAIRKAYEEGRYS